MKNIPKNAQNILEDMRKITILTGEISSIHEKSLSTWPYIVLDNVQNVEIKYDLSKATYENVGYNLIDFFVTLSDQDVSDLEKRCETLKKWTQEMLWSEIEINVHINNTLVYSTDSDK